MNHEQPCKDFMLLKTPTTGKRTAETGQVALPNILLAPVAKHTAFVQAIHNLPAATIF